MQTTHSPFKQAFESKGLFSEVSKKIEEEEKNIQKKKEEDHKIKMEELRKQTIQDRKDQESYLEFEQYIKDMEYIKDEGGRYSKVNEKGKNRLFHILCSYIPFPDVHKVLDLKFEGKQKNCCFCKRGIISIEELMEKGGDVLLKSIQIDIKSLNGTSTIEINKEKETLFKNTFGDRKMGYTSLKTDTVICAPCFEQFMEWVSRGCLKENSMVLSAIRKIRTIKN